MVSRRSVIEFTHRKFGLVKSKNACRCERRLAQALKTGRVESGRLQFAGSNDALHAQRAHGEIQELKEARRAAALYRSDPDFRAPKTFQLLIRNLM